MWDKNEKELEDRIYKKFWEPWRFYTRESSKVLRQLAFGEGALFWFFKTHPCPMINIVMIGMSILVLYFIVDALQYIVGAINHRKEAKIYEKLVVKKIVRKEKEIGKDRETVSGINACYVIKIILLIAASVFLFSIFICNFSSINTCDTTPRRSDTTPSLPTQVK